jgi:hypothetical protein
MNDPIVDEVRSIRAAHAARFNYDLWAIYRDLKEQQERSGLKFVSFADEPSQALKPTETAISVSPGKTSLEAAPAPEL